MNDRIYISGPMSADTHEEREKNLKRFRLAEQLLRREGYRHIINPARVWTCRWPWLYKVIGYRLTILYDLWLVTRCNRIYKMTGWRGSRGAQMESCVAFHFGICNLVQTISEKIDKELERILH